LFRLFSLFFVMAATWLLLSGHYEPLILAFGAFSCALTVYVAHRRMSIVDEEGQPLQAGWRAPLYWIWLVKEILKSNLDVAKRILAPRLDITPRFITVDATQPTEFGQVIYANSITLTPGTTSLRVYDGKIDVHALTKESADGLLSGEMDRRVTGIERRT
jgi:multicomponent Na+:H+ antiporter subunit E